MIKTIKARFTDGALAPLEPLEFAEDEVVFITLQVKGKLAGFQGADRMPRTPVEIQEAEAAADEMKRYLYTARHRGIDCDCIYCAPTTAGTLNGSV